MIRLTNKSMGERNPVATRHAAGGSRLRWRWAACSAVLLLLVTAYVWATVVNVSVAHLWVEGTEYFVSPPQIPSPGPQSGLLLTSAQALETELRQQLINQGFPNVGALRLGVRRIVNSNPLLWECWPATNRPAFTGPGACLGVTSLTWDTSVREGISLTFDNGGNGPTTGFTFTWPGMEDDAAPLDGTVYGFIEQNDGSLKSIAAINPAVKASDLLNQVTGAVSVSRFVASSGAFEVYNGTSPVSDFPIRPDEGYVLGAGTDINAPIQVSGKVFVDLDTSGGFDPGEQIVGRQVLFNDSVAGKTRIGISDSLGDYLRPLPPGGNWTASVPPISTEIWSPLSNVLGTLTPGAYPGEDFDRAPIDDLAVSLFFETTPPYRTACSTPLNPADRVTKFCVNYRNTGDMAEDGAIVQLELPPDVSGVLYSTLTPSNSCTAALPSSTTLTGNTVEWTVPTFPRQTDCTLCLGLEVAQPIGDFLAGTARIFLPSGAADSFPATHNVDTRKTQDRCGLDPNDLQVEPVGCGADGFFVEQDLTYRTRFQNTGNAAAINVVVRHAVDASLDLTTLQLIETSHPLTSVEIEGDSQLIWTFENINLPDEASDPEGSNGFVLYRIDPKPGLPVGTEIANSAAIFFDLNEPVITNTVINTIAVDTDADTVPDPCDNCAADPNADQADADEDGLGDVCDPCTDADADGYGVPGDAACPVGPETDCDDGDASTSPGAAELCDDRDNNCDGSINEGFGALPELCNNVDDNCNGLVDEGNPGGGGACFIGSAFGECRFGTNICLSEFSAVACFQNQGPGPEVCGNSLDDDCDGAIDETTDDSDGDLVDNCVDNCADAFNPTQLDSDGDGDGDVCDCSPGDNSNPMPDPTGNTLRLAKAGGGQTDIEWDAVGEDSYNVYRGFFAPSMPFGYNQECLAPNVPEAVPTTQSADPLTPRVFSTFFYLVTSTCTAGNAESHAGTDSAGAFRPTPTGCPARTTDFDGDGIDNAIDNCLDFRNGSQSDTDTDGVGDVCDNCVELANPAQTDLDDDGIGDLCDPDADGDGVPEGDGTNPCTGGATVGCDDNCPNDVNPGQEDADGDGIGDACE